MPSNEAIEILENVLSSVSESERWQYRLGDIREEQKERERKRVLMGKNAREYNDIETPTEELKLARKGITKRTFPDDAKYEIDQRRNLAKSTLSSTIAPKGYVSTAYELKYPGFKSNNSGTNGIHYIEREPEHKDMHDRINARTEEYDTTAKHEAVMILIEALNTLLNG